MLPYLMRLHEVSRKFINESGYPAGYSDHCKFFEVLMLVYDRPPIVPKKIMLIRSLVKIFYLPSNFIGS